MKWMELLRKEKVFLLQSESNTQFCVCSNFDVTAPENQQYDNGKYFCYWEKEDLKPVMLSRAVDYFRSRTEENYIPYSRLEELATVFKDGLIEDDKESAMEYFGNCGLEDYERDFLGIPDEEYPYGECQESIDDVDDYCLSATAGDYSPGNPWDAPGMSISDFI